MFQLSEHDQDNQIWRFNADIILFITYYNDYNYNQRLVPKRVYKTTWLSKEHESQGPEGLNPRGMI